MSQFSFQYPLAFALIILFWACAKFCPARVEAIYFPHVHNLLISKGRKNRLLDLLKWLGVVSLLLALASPVVTKSYKNSKKNGRDIMLVIDASGSMRQRGFDINNPMNSKFDVVKDVVKKFIDKRKNDRLGLITFADVAFVASPLTFEHKFLRNIVDMQRLGIAGTKTAINDALLQTYNVLSKSNAKSKIIILLTDGVDTASRIQPKDIIDIIKKSNVRLYTIGIGRRGEFDSRYLRMLSGAGHGKFFTAQDRNKLKGIYSQIDKLEASKLKSKKIVEHKYLYIYPLFIAILSLLLFIYLKTAKEHA